MSTSTAVFLPANTKVQDVADVIGLLLGQTHYEYALGNGDSVVKVRGVELSNAGQCLEDCCYINITGATVGESEWKCLYQFEFDDDGSRGFLKGSTPLNIALATRLVDFFGGKVIYRDYDDDSFYGRIQPNFLTFYDFAKVQEKKLSVQPLTKDDVKACRELAEYE